MSRRKNSFKKVKELKNARITSPPPFAKQPPLKDIPLLLRKGISYERKVFKYIGAILGGGDVEIQPWWEFEDAQGRRWCSPDFIWSPEEAPGLLIVGEAKLSYTNIAPKFRGLYKPIASYLYPGKVVKSLQVCRSIKNNMKGALIKDAAEVYSSKFDYHVLAWRPF